MIKNLLQEGFALKSKGHYKHAIEVFYKALECDNSSNELMLEIAELYYLINNEERALSYIEQVLEKEPTHIDALKLLKRIFWAKGAYAEAEQAAKNIYCVSRSAVDLTEILKLLNLQNKFDEILEYSFETPTFEIYFEQSKGMFNKGDFEKAEKILQKGLDIKPDSQEALLLLGKIYYAQNMKDKCSELLQKLTIDEKDAELLNFIGLVKAYQCDYNFAIKTFLKTIALNRSNSQYYYNLANVYFKTGDFLSAKKYYNMAISICPENPNYNFALANLYYAHKHYKKALEVLTDDLYESKLLKAIILYDTGYLALAKQQLLLLFAERPDSVIANDYLQRINEELGLN